MSSAPSLLTPGWVERLSPNTASALVTAAGALLWLQLAIVDASGGSLRLALVPTEWRLGLPLIALAVVALVALAARFRFALLTPGIAVLALGLGLQPGLAFFGAQLVFA
ncbi:MAG TPA: hypothetical protein VEQ58_23870, partial [Polyangiaceae bacterium]|nr:hypothetical protein [Polyangiaceae bacterium]